MRTWPVLSQKSLDGLVNCLTYMIRERTQDISDFENIKRTFIAGRRVLGRVPSSSADVVDGDVIGDVSYTTTFLYILMDNAGTPVWRRVALSSF